LIEDKFARLGVDNAPGQEIRQDGRAIESLLRGEKLSGVAVDFSHGDVDAHEPTPRSFEIFSQAVAMGGRQAYTEYRGDAQIRQLVGARLADFTGAPVEAQEGLMITPGTQGALFLALAATLTRGDKVAIIEPDYFANRKLVEFFEGEIVPIPLDYHTAPSNCAGLDLGRLSEAFSQGVRLMLFSNPNNPAGVVYGRAEIEQIAALACSHGVTVIVDQLYSRLLYENVSYTHLRGQDIDEENLVTIMGPSKTESLSGYRLGVAFGSKSIIARMEKLQAIVCLRAAGYNQAVLRCWFDEAAGWMERRIRAHQQIRDDLITAFRAMPGVSVRPPDAGSYIFPRLPKLAVSYADFVKILRIQAGITVTSGSEFGPTTKDSIRLNFSQNARAAGAAIQRLGEMIERYRA